MLELYREQWHAELNAERDNQGIGWDEDRPERAALDIGRQALELAIAELVPHFGDPVNVQRRLEFTLAPGLAWTVLCYLDLETLKEQPAGEPVPTVVDLKVKTTPLGQDEADSDPQAGLYLAGRWPEGYPANRPLFAQVAKPGICGNRNMPAMLLLELCCGVCAFQAACAPDPGVREPWCDLRRPKLAVMLAEHEERFRRITSEFLERPAGDYAELLRRGHVSSPEGVDPDEWREEIRRKTRQDKIRVITSRDGAGAFAMLNRKIPDDQAMDVMRHAFDRTTLLGELARRSAELGHQLSSWLGHDDESIAFCEHCGARIYTRRGPPTVQDGEALTDSCPGPPA